MWSRRRCGSTRRPARATQHSSRRRRWRPSLTPWILLLPGPLGSCGRGPGLVRGWCGGIAGGCRPRRLRVLGLRCLAALGVDELVEPADLAVHRLQPVPLQLEGVAVDPLPGPRERGPEPFPLLLDGAAAALEDPQARVCGGVPEEREADAEQAAVVVGLRTGLADQLVEALLALGGDRVDDLAPPAGERPGRPPAAAPGGRARRCSPVPRRASAATPGRATRRRCSGAHRAPPRAVCAARSRASATGAAGRGWRIRACRLLRRPCPRCIETIHRHDMAALRAAPRPMPSRLSLSRSRLRGPLRGPLGTAVRRLARAGLPVMGRGAYIGGRARTSIRRGLLAAAAGCARRRVRGSHRLVRGL